MEQRVEYIDWGLANFYEDHIEINRGLSKDKNLRDYVIRHELGHVKGFDLKHEFDYSNFKLLGKLGWFVLKNPKTWIDFLPIQYKKGNLIIDYNQIIQYIIIIGLIIGLYFLLKFIF